jgi:hypothetical protein
MEDRTHPEPMTGRYPELEGERPSVLSWEVAAARSRAIAACRRFDRAKDRRNHAYAVVYGVILAGAVLLADSGGAPGLL